MITHTKKPKEGLETLLGCFHEREYPELCRCFIKGKYILPEELEKDELSKEEYYSLDLMHGWAVRMLALGLYTQIFDYSRAKAIICNLVFDQKLIINLMTGILYSKSDSKILIPEKLSFDNLCVAFDKIFEIEPTFFNKLFINLPELSHDFKGENLLDLAEKVMVHPLRYVLYLYMKTIFYKDISLHRRRSLDDPSYQKTRKR